MGALFEWKKQNSFPFKHCESIRHESCQLSNEGMMTIPLKISHGGPDAIGGRDEPTDCHCGLLAQIHQVPGL